MIGVLPKSVVWEMSQCRRNGESEDMRSLCTLRVKERRERPDRRFVRPIVPF